MRKDSGCIVWPLFISLQIVLIITKLLGVIAAPWIAVLIPLWVAMIAVAIVVLWGFFIFIVAAIIALVES